jgi:hypothetical protein
VAIAKCGRENGDERNTPRSLNSIIIGENRGDGHLDMHIFLRAVEPEAPGPWIVPGMSLNCVEG